MRRPAWSVVAGCVAALSLVACQDDGQQQEAPDATPSPDVEEDQEQEEQPLDVVVMPVVPASEAALEVSPAVLAQVTDPDNLAVSLELAPLVVGLGPGLSDGLALTLPDWSASPEQAAVCGVSVPSFRVEGLSAAPQGAGFEATVEDLSVRLGGFEPGQGALELGWVLFAQVDAAQIEAAPEAARACLQAASQSGVRVSLRLPVEVKTIAGVDLTASLPCGAEVSQRRAAAGARLGTLTPTPIDAQGQPFVPVNAAPGRAVEVTVSVTEPGSLVQLDEGGDGLSFEDLWLAEDATGTVNVEAAQMAEQVEMAVVRPESLDVPSMALLAQRADGDNYAYMSLRSYELEMIDELYAMLIPIVSKGLHFGGERLCTNAEPNWFAVSTSTPEACSPGAELPPAVNLPTDSSQVVLDGIKVEATEGVCTVELATAVGAENGEPASQTISYRTIGF